MKNKNIIVAFCYDFDGTLSPGNMQEHSLLPALGLEATKFWADVKAFAEKNNANEVLSYMYLILEKAREKNFYLTKADFKEHGKDLQLFKGLPDYFERINNYAGEKGIEIKHYIISSGLKEIIEGNAISKYFDYIFASQFYYDNEGIAHWPAVAIDYTNKTQHLFRINKGILNMWDNSRINKFTPEEERDIPFSRIIYIGDGETDVPSMKMVNHQGGYTIAVYNPSKQSSKNERSPREVCMELVQYGRAQFAAPADYSSNSPLFNLLKAIIDKIKAEAIMEKVKYHQQIILDQHR